MITLIVFIAVLALLVLVHEAGHFFVARRAGVRVDEFGFGFPPRLFGIYRDPETKKFVALGPRQSQKLLSHDHRADEPPEAKHAPYHEFPATVYSINSLPLGGFVKIKGEEGQHKDDRDSFAHKKPWVRALILSAGVLMNAALAAVLLSVGFMVGIPAILGGELPSGAQVFNQKTEIIEVLSGGPASAAGVLIGDIVVNVNGEPVANQKEAFEHLSAASRAGDVQLDVRRGATMTSLVMTPTVITEIGRPGIGVALADTALVRLSWYRAIPEGIIATGTFFVEILRAFGTIIANAFRGVPVADQLSGPVGIAVMTGQAARLGFSYLLQFTAVLSLNLALVNIVPIPALDGGRLLFVAIEKIRRGKTVPKGVERALHAAAFALLLFLVMIVTVRDISRLF